MKRKLEIRNQRLETRNSKGSWSASIGQSVVNGITFQSYIHYKGAAS